MTLCHILPERRGWVNRIIVILTSLTIISEGQKYMSSSSCCATSTDLPDSFSPPISIVHRSQELFKAISCNSTELLYIGSSWLSCLCSSIRRVPLKYIAYEYVLTSPAVSHMPGSSNLDSFHDGLYVAIQLLLWEVLLPGLVQYCLQQSCVIGVKLFLHTFSQSPCSASIYQYWHNRCWLKPAFFKNLSGLTSIWPIVYW